MRKSKFHYTNSCILFASWLWGLIPVSVSAGDFIPQGRYLDINVQVQDTAQRNPLRQIVDLQFSDRISIGKAVKTALSGTGYQLTESNHPKVQLLLSSRLAFVHNRFEQKRIDSAIAAIVGVGRGFEIDVDHLSRVIRIIPITRPESEHKQILSSSQYSDSLFPRSHP